MDARQHTQIVNFIWGIADTALRGALNRTKYRDVILPMTVIRRLDALLEPSKQKVLEQDKQIEQMGLLTSRDQILKQTTGLGFYNTSQFSLKQLTANPKNIHADMLAYLDGFSANVRDILDRFNFRGHLADLHREERLGPLIEKFTDPRINLSPNPSPSGQPGLDNHAMGTVFEELLRRFNEENNEEAGEHFTPRDVVNLMTNLVIEPVANRITNQALAVYDGACGTGGMLTVAQERILELAKERGVSPAVRLYGQELNPETWAIAQADLLVQGGNPDDIKLGSTLGNDQFPTYDFEFMISNPPYGVDWKSDMARLGGRGNITDPRFVRSYAGDESYSMLTRASDGQLLFLANLISKMQDPAENNGLGSRIAEIHNGSSLFTGDAGQGESNIRRWIIENDWLEAIIALPNNMFYNTGIATYIWVLSNTKEDRRRGKVQLIDATQRFTPRRKNLGSKNADLSDADQRAIMDAFMAFEETEHSKIFPNEAFGYRKVVVERPLRLRVEIPEENPGLTDNIWAALRALVNLTGITTFEDYNLFDLYFTDIARDHGIRLTAALKRKVRDATAIRDESAAPVVQKYLDERLSDISGVESWNVNHIPPNRRLAGVGIAVPHIPFRAIGENPFPSLVTFEPDPDLRDTEQIPLDQSVEEFIGREVWPYAEDAWVPDPDGKIGYEISFTRYFYKPKQLRTLAEIEADIRALEAETDGLLEEILQN